MLQPGPMWVQHGACYLWHATKHSYQLIASWLQCLHQGFLGSPFSSLPLSFSAPQLQMVSYPALPNTTVAIKMLSACFFSPNTSKLRGL